MQFINNMNNNNNNNTNNIIGINNNNVPLATSSCFPNLSSSITATANFTNTSLKYQEFLQQQHRQQQLSSSSFPHTISMNSENPITTTAAIDNDSQQTAAAAAAAAALSFDQTKGLQQQLLWTPQDNNNYNDANVNDNKCQHITTISSTTIPSAPATPTASTTPTTPTTTQKPYETPKVPRPPNAFIIYHRTKSKELARYKSSIRSNSSSNNSNNGHPSKTVAEMWREETDAVKLRYQREADLALVEHKKKYPFYKYRPRKRENKNKLKTRGCGGAGNKCVNNNNGNWKCCKCVNNNSNCNEGCKCDNLIIINDGVNENSYNNNNHNNGVILSPTDSEFGIVNKDDDHHDGSEVPPEHRKQASMESAFTVFDMKSLEEETDGGNNDDNISNTNNNDSIRAIKKNTFSPPQTPKTPNFLNSSDHHPLSLITMASKMPQTAIISSLLQQQLYHSPIEDLHHQQFSLQMSREDSNASSSSSFSTSSSSSASSTSSSSTFNSTNSYECPNAIDLDNGQSTLVINQPDHLQQQLMFTQDEFQQFPSELTQDDWNTQLFNYINGNNASSDGYYVQNFMNLFAAANPFPLDLSSLNDYNVNSNNNISDSVNSNSININNIKQEDVNSSDNYGMVSLQPQSIAPRRSIMISPQPPLPQLLLQQHQEPPPTPTSPLDAFPMLSMSETNNNSNINNVSNDNYGNGYNGCYTIYTESQQPNILEYFYNND